MINHKPILVTGSHRSGSTWVGTMLAASPSVGYIQEPFSLNHRSGIFSAKFDYWFPYITPENELDLYHKFSDTLKFKYDLIEELKEIKTIRDILRLGKDYLIFAQYRLSQARPLIKDPLAFFLAEWLAEKYNMDVVILIRHPAAFASSLKVKNWKFPFKHFLQQPLLIEKYLKPFAWEIEKYDRQEYDIIDQSILLWKILYSTALEYKNKHSDWIFLRHEDLSKNPLYEFKNLYNKIDLDFTDRVKKKIEKYSDSKNLGKTYQENIKFYRKKTRLNLKRDSQSNIENWKNRLTEAEIEKIRTSVESISSHFYADRDW